MPGLLRGVARTAVIAGTATHVSNNVSRRQANRWAEKEQAQPAYMAPVGGPPPEGQYAPGYDQPPAQVPASTGSDSIAQLRELGELHASGVLTDEEFAVQKSRILNG